MPKQKGGGIFTDILYYIGLAIVGFLAFLFSLFWGESEIPRDGPPEGPSNAANIDPDTKEIPTLRYLSHQMSSDGTTIIVNIEVVNQFGGRYKPSTNKNYYAYLTNDSTRLGGVDISPSYQKISSNNLQFRIKCADMVGKNLMGICKPILNNEGEFGLVVKDYTNNEVSQSWLYFS